MGGNESEKTSTCMALAERKVAAFHYALFFRTFSVAEATSRDPDLK